MCYILTAIKLKDNQEVKDSILSLMESEQNSNDDGTASLCYSKNKNAVIRRDLLMTWQEMSNDLDNFDVVNYHFRIATKGKPNINNVHFWKSGNWAFCHNGGIQEMGNDEESDSLSFFNELIAKKCLHKNNKLSGQKIKDVVNEKNFWGRFLLVNLKTKNIYFFGDFRTYLVQHDYLVITSASADFEKKLNVMGLTFPLEDDKDKLEVIESELEGVNYWDYKEQQFFNIFTRFKEIKTTSYGGSRSREVNASVYHNGNSVGFKGKEESGNLNNNEKAVESVRVLTPRTDESYLKEFSNRLQAQIKKENMLAIDIQQELDNGYYNEFGRTLTEDDFWELWIVPQMEARKEFREIIYRPQLAEIYLTD